MSAGMKEGIRNHTMTKSPNVLAIDGGGIRAIIPALILAEIERRTHTLP